MRKLIAFLTTLVLLVSMLPQPLAAAVDTETTIPATTPQHLALDFENGFDIAATGAGVHPNDTAVWVEDGCGASKGALKFSSAANFKSVSFPLRTVAGNTYKVSLWVKMDETPKEQYASIVFYNKSLDGSSTCWNEVRLTKSSDFEAGKWVYLTVDYNCNGTGRNTSEKNVPLNEEGTVEFRFGSGKVSSGFESGKISYTLDEFFVTPSVNNPVSDADLISDGGFETEEAMNSAWVKTSNASVTHVTPGANGTEGAAQVNVNALWSTIRTTDSLDIQLCKDYTLTFWAKATNEDAVGKMIWGYLGFTDFTSSWLHIQNTANILTDEWQKFEINFTPMYVSDTLPTSIKLYFRVGSNDENEAGLKASYQLDEISLRQTGDANFSTNIQVFGAANAGNNVAVTMNMADSTRGKIYYRVIKETAEGEYCLASGENHGGYLPISNNQMVDGNARIEVFGTDLYGNYSQVNTQYFDSFQVEDSVHLTPNQYLWNNDTKNLSTTVTYDSQLQDQTIQTVVAQYDADGALVSVVPDVTTVAKGAKDSWTVEAPVESTAVRAKFFAWYAESNAPATYAEELHKTTTGEFIYVDANSTQTTENGSFDAPYKTLYKARTKLQNRVLRSTEDTIYVVFKSGEYALSDNETLALGAADFAQNKQVVFTSWEGEKATLGHAHHVTGWTHWKDGIYRARVPEGLTSRQMYVDGVKATRARTIEDPKGFDNLDYDDYTKQKEETPSDETFKYSCNYYGMVSDNTDYTDPEKFPYPDEIEFSFIQNWRQQYVMASGVEPYNSADSETTGLPASETVSSGTRFLFEAVDGDKKDWVWNWLVSCNTRSDLPVYVTNALAFLDEEGEWYLDTHENVVYYKPRYFENIATADVVIPAGEKILTAIGTVDAPIENISFNSLNFAYATWNHPTTNKSFANGQNATYQGDRKSWDGGSLMDGAVELKNVRNIKFDNCDFFGLGGIGLKMTGAVQNVEVLGNEFYEISGSAIALGDVSTTDKKTDGTSWNVTSPSLEEKYLINNNKISNNYIHKVATDYMSAAGICAGFPQNTVISHNELTDGSYSGMHTGWGWAGYAKTGSGTKNFVIENNYIHNFMNWRLFDGAGIYTLGATGGAVNPATGLDERSEETRNKIRRNYFKDMKNHYGAIYPDEGSTWWDITENVVDQKNYPLVYGKEGTPTSQHWLHVWTTSIQDLRIWDNYSTNGTARNNGTNVSLEPAKVYADAAWPDAAQQIIAESGIERKYQNRFDFGLQSLTLPIRQELTVGETQPLIYNAVSSKDKLFDIERVDIKVKSSDESVATATVDGLTAVGEGKAWITFSMYVEENGKVYFYDEQTFYVIVKASEAE